MVHAKKPCITEAEFKARDDVDDRQRTFTNQSDYTMLVFSKSMENACFSKAGEKSGTLKLPEAVSKHIKR